MRNKNLVIGGLLSVLLIMAIAYAAFSTSLSINGTATITGSWNIGYDTSKTSDYLASAGISGGTTPTGSITFDGNQKATVSANLNQPGDSVVFTLTILNTGSIKATLGTPSLSSSTCSVSGLTCTTTSGNIKFTVTSPTPTTLAASTGEATMTVTAEYVNKEVTSASAESASITVTTVATQATS